MFGRDLRLQSSPLNGGGGRMHDHNNADVSTSEVLYGGYGSCKAGTDNGHSGGFGGGGGGG